MPNVAERDGRTLVEAAGFSVVYERCSPHFFTVAAGTLVQRFLIPASCDSLERKDLTVSLVDRRLREMPDRVQFTFEYISSLWRKTYYIDIFDDHVAFYYDIVGCASVSNLRFFEGISAVGFEEDFFTAHFNDRKPTPYRHNSRASPVGFQLVFNPEPNVYDKRHFEYFDYSVISVNSDFTDYCGGSFYFNPGILCFVIGTVSRQTWLTLGLAVRPGEYLFSDFEYRGGTEFGLALNYCGVHRIDGAFRSPAIVMFCGTDEVESIATYTRHLRREGLTPEPTSERQDWWCGPIICPVGHQYYQTDLFRRRSPGERPRDTAGYFACTQLNCEEFIRLIDAWHLPWRIFVIDVKWFINGGQKIVDVGRWPDMRRFVDDIHRKGKRVLIWWSPWDTEGWSSEECITFNHRAAGEHRNPPGKLAKFESVADGARLGPDITLPAVREKVTRQLHELLSAEGVNADGVKIDHTAATPGLYGMVFPANSAMLYGIELLRYYQSFLYQSVKRIKRDALVVGQSANPYFADCIDMVRMGDTYSRSEHSIVDQMAFRVQMARVANSEWLVDLDGWPMPSVTALAEYAAYQVGAGVPTLCYASHLDTTGELIPENVMLNIKELWDRYVRGRPVL
ncbi:MAG: TIM-barrel domain-containing protein [Thermoanaerobaculia bacterium]